MLPSAAAGGYLWELVSPEIPSGIAAVVGVAGTGYFLLFGDEFEAYVRAQLALISVSMTAVGIDSSRDPLIHEVRFFYEQYDPSRLSEERPSSLTGKTTASSN